MSARLADRFQMETPRDDRSLENLMALIGLCQHEHEEMSTRLDQADDLRERLEGIIDHWTTEAATLVSRQQKGREDRIYAQACRDHATEIGRCLRLEPPLESSSD